MNRSNLTSGFNQSGFTLLEILIAITILAFITLGVVDITENAALTMERTTEANTNNLQIETAMSRLEWDISQIYSPLYFSTVMNLNQNVNNIGAVGGNQGSDSSGVESGEREQAGAQGGVPNNPYLQQYYEQLITRFERNEHFSAVSREGYPIPRFYAPEKNVFEFFTSSNRRKLENQQQSHFAWVRYSLGDQTPLPSEDENLNIPKSLKSLVRYFSADDPYSDKRINIEDAQRVKGAVLLRNVENLEFQFWDFQKRRWETSLRSIPSGENIIRGIKVLVTWYDSLGHKRTTTRIFRTHWPMVTPQDQPVNQGRAAGFQAGAAAAGGVAAGEGNPDEN